MHVCIPLKPCGTGTCFGSSLHSAPDCAHRSVLSLSLLLWMCCSRMVPRCWMVRMMGVRPSAPPRLLHSSLSTDNERKSILSRQPDCRMLTARSGNLPAEGKQFCHSGAHHLVEKLLCCIHHMQIALFWRNYTKTLRSSTIPFHSMKWQKWLLLTHNLWYLQQPPTIRLFCVQVLTHQSPPLI